MKQMKFDFSEEGRRKFYRDINEIKDLFALEMYESKDEKYKACLENIYKDIINKEEEYKKLKASYFIGLRYFVKLKERSNEIFKAETKVYGEKEAKTRYLKREMELAKNIGNPLRKVSINYKKELEEIVKNHKD